MTVTLAILTIGLVGALVIGALSVSRRVAADPIDTEPVEHWLVHGVRHRPRLRQALVGIDRRAAGGLAIVVTFVVLWSAGLFVGWVLDTVDSNRGFARWDEAVAEWGSANSTDASTRFLSAVTRLGETTYLLVLAAVIGAADFARRRNADVAMFLGTVVVGVAAVNNAIKWLVDRERPVVEHLIGSGGSSFPSGHSAAAAACWAGVALVASRWTKRRYRPLLVGGVTGIALLVAASRALLGVHWLTDVIAGVVVGWSWFLLVALAFGGRLQRLGEPVERAGTRQLEVVR